MATTTADPPSCRDPRRRRLMGADEEGTHERLKAHLRDLVDPQIREHYGRIVKTTGLL
jgi:class 3 adenylate cyclase